VVENGLLAVAACARTRYDLILMDGRMPEMDGATATRLIRAGGPLEAPVLDQHLMIVALTANASDEDRSRYLACGMDAFLTKPIDDAQLHFHLSRAIERQLQRGIELQPMPREARGAARCPARPSWTPCSACQRTAAAPAAAAQNAGRRASDLKGRMRAAFAADLPRRRAELDAALAAGDPGGLRPPAARHARQRRLPGRGRAAPAVHRARTRRRRRPPGAGEGAPARAAGDAGAFRRNNGLNRAHRAPLYNLLHNNSGDVMKVLIVDDDVVSRMMLMHMIDSAGSYDVLEAEDGEEAWRQLDAGPRPAMLFCDLRMPRLSGMELLARVKADERFAGLPFVLVSAAADGATMEQAIGLGADGYIVKPFDSDKVRGYLAGLAENGGQADESPDATMRRLGIDAARLLLYLGGLHRQLAGAGADIGQLLAAGQPDAARAHLGRLADGCRTLGLLDAAAALGTQAALPSSGVPVAELDAACAAVLRQLDAARRLSFS
jgi:two-component system chemotaxis response regulator CheY